MTDPNELLQPTIPEARTETIPPTSPEIISSTKTEEETSPEARKKAEKTICRTLEIDENSSLENFSDKLAEATRALPRYQELKTKLDNVPLETIGYSLFEEIQRANDAPVNDEAAPIDGVLISSMRSGKLECAGRTLLASTYLQERNINHTVVSAPGHSFMLIEQGQDTMAYFDANNNLYFTFPREALSGYQGKNAVSECRLKDYAPKESDTVDGLNTPFTYFITIPASEGVSRQYLGNVQSALAGNKEFVKTNIAVDQKASEVVDDIEKDLLGKKDPILENFIAKSEDNIEMTELQSQADRKLISELLTSNPEQDNFAQAFAKIVRGELGNRLVFLKNASEEARVNYGRRVWEFFQSPATIEQITRMQ